MTAQDLSYVDDANNKKYNPSATSSNYASQSPQQTIAQRTIGALADPFSNAMSNYNTTKDAFSGGHYVQGIFDTIGMAKNPTGNWGTPQAQAQAQQQPAFEDHHFSGTDSNGNRILNDTGKAHAIQSAMPISDNSNLVSQFHGSGNTPMMATAPITKGRLGRSFDSFKGNYGFQSSNDLQKQNQDQ